MDTSNFDSQDRQHLKVYANFMNLSKIATVAIIITLALMAINLL